MFKKKFFVFTFLFAALLNYVYAIPINKNSQIKSLKASKLKWTIKEKSKSKIKWESKNNRESFKNYNINKGLDSQVKGLGRAVTVNGIPYPEISNYVPNAFVEDWQKNFTVSIRGISKTRSCSNKNFDKNCIDGVLDLDFNLINREKFSFNPKINIQSLESDNGGTNIGEGISFGFKAAKEISPKWSLAFGGENIIHTDSTIDLGRNFYLVGSTYYPLNNDKKNRSFIFINAGIGSDFYGYKGNGYLARSSCFGPNTLTGEGTNKCNWGPIGSVAIAFNDKLSFVNEWFGYGYGSGISFKPFKLQPISFSLYATDYFQKFPSYIEEGCFNNECSARYYGSINFSF